MTDITRPKSPVLSPRLCGFHLQNEDMCMRLLTLTCANSGITGSTTPIAVPISNDEKAIGQTRGSTATSFSVTAAVLDGGDHHGGELWYERRCRHSAVQVTVGAER